MTNSDNKNMSGDDKITLEMIAQLKKLIADPIVDVTRNQAEDIRQINEKLGVVIAQNEAYAVRIDSAAKSFDAYRIEHQEDHKHIEAKIQSMSGLLDCNIEKVDDKVSECQKNCVKTLQPIWEKDIKSALLGTENKDLKKKMSKLEKMGIAALPVIGAIIGFLANKFFGGGIK